jgi:hypothetical protein
MLLGMDVVVPAVSLKSGSFQEYELEEFLVTSDMFGNSWPEASRTAHLTETPGH